MKLKNGIIILSLLVAGMSAAQSVYAVDYFGASNDLSGTIGFDGNGGFNYLKCGGYSASSVTETVLGGGIVVKFGLEVTAKTTDGADTMQLLVAGKLPKLGGPINLMGCYCAITNIKTGKISKINAPCLVGAQ